MLENRKTWNITWERKLLYSDKWILPEDIAILNINAPNNRVLKFIEVKTKIIKERNRHIKEYSYRFNLSFWVPEKIDYYSIRI